MALTKRSKRIPDTFWERAQVFPPILCRLLAREQRGGHPAALTDADLSNKSGLTMYQVSTISQLLSWDEVELSAMHRFVQACGLDFCDPKEMKRLTMYMRRGRMRYLRKHPLWNNQFEPLLQRWHRHCALPLMAQP